MTSEAQILNVITHSEPSSRTLSAWLTVYKSAHPDASDSAALMAYASACAELEAVL